MSRARVAALIVSLAVLPLQAQIKPSDKAPPGTTLITSFDRDHTVIGWLEIFPFESKIFHNTRMLRVLVPANYLSPHNAHRSYPVLYMQDGQNLFDEATSAHGEWHMDETVEHLVGSFKIPPMLVVGIDNAGEQRAAEYLPYPDAHNDKFSAEKSVHGNDYARFLVTEVMPFIEKHYRVSRGALNTGLGGSSYGADIALYTALKYPGVFGHLLLESPLLWIGDDQLLKDAQKAKLLPQRMEIAIGTAEAGDAAYDAKELNDVEELEKGLRKKGMTAARLRVAIDAGSEPNEATWSRRLPDALLFLYGE
jgi:predicted alpha/beta superfamily hydrolase